MKVQNCLTRAPPPRPARTGAAGCWCPPPGAPSGHCRHPPACAPTNRYFALQFRSEVIHNTSPWRLQ